jgi:hypothetical protein
LETLCAPEPAQMHQYGAGFVSNQLVLIGKRWPCAGLQDFPLAGWEVQPGTIVTHLRDGV